MFGFGFFDSVFPVLFTVMFVLILGVIIATLVRNVGQWHKNNKSPRLTVQATVVSKRMEVTRHHDVNSHMSHSSTWYYATFQVESGDRMELSIPDRDYGYLVEGDEVLVAFFLGAGRVVEEYLHAQPPAVGLDLPAHMAHAHDADGL